MVAERGQHMGGLWAVHLFWTSMGAWICRGAAVGTCDAGACPLCYRNAHDTLAGLVYVAVGCRLKCTPQGMTRRSGCHFTHTLSCFVCIYCVRPGYLQTSDVSS